MYEILQTSFYNNTIFAYILSAIVLIGCIVAIKLFRKIVIKAAEEFAKKTATLFDDFLVFLFVKNILPLLYFFAFYIAADMLTLPEGIAYAINVTMIVTLTYTAVRLINMVINYLFKNVFIKNEPEFSKQTMLKGIMPAIRTLVWVLGILFMLDNLGFKITTVIAGLGIGGVAVALASQTILGDLFCYFAILFDQPFVLGDFIIIGEYLGTIEHIGIKTTRIRSLGGEQLVFSNSDLTNSRVRNYKRMNTRRVLFQFGVTYQTSMAQLKEIPILVKEIVTSLENTTFDRAHFYKFGDSSLVFEVVYYVLSSDYNVYMDTQQSINLALKEKLEDYDIEFAYPTQTLYVNTINSTT